MPDLTFCYKFPRPAVTVDTLVFAHRRSELVVLLIRRRHPPFAGSWAIPGGFLEIAEAVEDGARRELREETGLALRGPLHFLGLFGRPGRDPRERTISLAHAVYLPGEPPDVSGGDDAGAAEWRPAVINDPEAPLAFDHDEILQQGLSWIGDFDGVKVDLFSS